MTDQIHMQKHPLIPLPSVDQVMAMGETEEERTKVWGDFMLKRTEAIHNMEDDPLRYGWEPGIWHVCDALLGWPCRDSHFVKEIKDRFGDDWDWNTWSREMRCCLGFSSPVRLLLINGGNRGGKSQYGAKRSVELLYDDKAKNVWGMHNTRTMSVDFQMPVVYGHLPREVRDRVPIQDGRPEYIAYKTATGFSNDKLVNALGSAMMFKWYTSDPRDIEGGEVDLVWGDEHIDADRVHTLKLRVATRDGKVLITFTPTEGYTETVRMFQDGADIVRSCDAFLLPDDEGDPIPWAALGFPNEAAWLSAQKLGPNSIPEDVHAWIEGTRSQPEVPAGRKFKKVPRVMRCVGQMEAGKIRYNAAVVFFHSNDNPFGNPEVVYRMCAGKNAAFIKERFYGVAEKGVSNAFPKFNEKVHVVEPDQVPAGGTNYCFCDPSTGRNFVFLWVRMVKDIMYVYREWPGNYVIPGVGLPGPWAEVDGKRPDGRKGPAQNPFGFDLLGYKKEIMRLEEWELPQGEYKVEDVQPGPATKERIGVRFIDARGSGGRADVVSGTDTLLEQMNDKMSMEWHPVTLSRGATGSELQTGVALINDALFYDDSRDVDLTNRPRLYISSACQNLIFSMKVWTGADGNKGACKDFIDLLRYAYSQHLEDMGDATYAVTGGGCH